MFSNEDEKNLTRNIDWKRQIIIGGVPSGVPGGVACSPH